MGDCYTHSRNCSRIGISTIEHRRYPLLENLEIQIFMVSSKQFPFFTIEVSLNYTKLATLPTKVYTGKSNINSAKKLPPVGIEPRTSSDLLTCHQRCC